uniref:VWFA domain-containing protein n=1 Tax=Hucho hucho TaxID=62062 RepID=A0A4W5P2B6_9TELE
MKGLRLTIARQTVSSILDTLGDDDFFNVIAYNDEVHYVEPCLNGTLVQADVTNKDHFRMNLDKLLAKGIGMLDVGLTEAFEVLSDFNQTGRGSVCSQAIMLVTDGAVDTYDSVFAKYNWPDRKWINPLCDNSRMALCSDDIHCIPKCACSFFQNRIQNLEDGQGPILMTTVAMPVFSTKNETRNRGILLGVVGTDVPVSELLKTIPKYKVLTLPQLHKKRRKPNYSSVDLSEVEWEDKDDIVRLTITNISDIYCVIFSYINFTFPQTSKCFLSNGIKNMHILASGPKLQAVRFGYVILSEN